MIDVLNLPHPFPYRTCLLLLYEHPNGHCLLFAAVCPLLFLFLWRCRLFRVIFWYHCRFLFVLYGEYAVIFFPLPDGVFLPCDHVLDFYHPPMRKFVQFKRTRKIDRESFLHYNIHVLRFLRHSLKKRLGTRTQLISEPKRGFTLFGALPKPTWLTRTECL